MGTVVLLPQDCLPTSKSRHKSDLSETFYHANYTPQARRNTVQDFGLKSSPYVYSDLSRQKIIPSRAERLARSGSLPLPDHGANCLHVNMSPKQVEGKKAKARRPTEIRDTKFVTKPVPNAPVVTILQRPKNKEAADEVMAMVHVQGAKAPNDTNVDGCESKNCEFEGCLDLVGEVSKIQQTTSAESKIPLPFFKKLGLDTNVEVRKAQDLNTEVLTLQNSDLGSKINRSPKDLKLGRNQLYNGILGATKPLNVLKRKSHNGSDELVPSEGLSQIASLKVPVEHRNLKTAGAVKNFNCKVVYANQPAKNGIVMPERSRRASTDPQMVEHLVGQYRSTALEIPFSEAQSCYGFTRTSSMSYPERWAGPAYFSSPAPSSLPLPKFFRPNQKTCCLDFSSSLEEGCTKNSVQSRDSGSAPTSLVPPEGGALDVAFATKSLRRMLKLDPF